MSVTTDRPILVGGLPAGGEGATLPVVDPWSGETIADVSAASPAQVDAAVAAAADAFATYRRAPAHLRAELLERVAERVEQRGEDLAQLIVGEAGKTIREARTECERAATTLRIAAEEAKRIGGEVVPLDAVPLGTGHLGQVRRFPVGPVAAITPFNSPLNLVAHKLAPALAAGNTVLVKPAERTPLSALALGDAVAEAALELALPPGIVSVLPCSADAAQTLVTHARVRVLTFTGSPGVGWKLRSLAGTKRVLLELGANGCAIVEPDAELAWAVDRCRVAAFAAAGQVCASVQRVLVARPLFEPFLQRLLADVEGMRAGDPSDPETDMGPMISPEAAAAVLAKVGDAVTGGASLLAGGDRAGGLVRPTVLTGTQAEMSVSCEEIFGPVVAVEPYDDFDEALALANAGPLGLQGSLFTRDVHTIHRAHAELEVGSLIVGDAGTWRVDQMPFGGVKGSGLGREGLKYAIREQCDERLLVLNLESRG